MSADNSQVGDRRVVVLERQPAHPAGPGSVIGPRIGTGTAIARAPAMPQRRSGILSWALFDYARTIFSFSVLMTSFGVWVTQDHKAPVYVYTLAMMAIMAIMAIVTPALGVLSDKAGRRLPFLLAVTGLMVGSATLLAFTTNLLVGLVLFSIATVGYQSTQVFYDALLGSITTEEKRSRISGLGSACGYLGTISWSLIALVYLSRSSTSAAFLPTAMVVALCALPCFLFVKERPAAPGSPITRADITASFAQILRSIHKVRRGHPNLARFLVARLLYADAANTVVAIMAVYSVAVVHLTKREYFIFMPSAVTFAVIGALTFGRLADRFGPKRMLNVILALWFVAMTWTAFVPTGTVHLGSLALPAKDLFYAVGPLAGLALGGLRACDRTFLLRLTPPAMIGEAFALFSLVGDAAAIVGPLIWTVVTFLFLKLGHEVLGYRVAILAIVGLLCVGWTLLRRTSDSVARYEPGESGVQPLPAKEAS
jgi:MFS transporter, UMF1 family